MADGIGHLRIIRDKRWESYNSLKQWWRSSDIYEVIYEGYQTTTAALAEVAETGGATILYTTGSEGTVYVRSEADLAALHGKSLYIEYLDGNGAVQTANVTLNASDSTTETAIATDFLSLRQFYSAYEAPTDNYLLLCNSDNTAKYGIIQDGRKYAAFSRYYVPAATSGKATHYLLGRVTCSAQTENEGDAVETGHQLKVTYTPKNGAAADISQIINFNDQLVWEPCVELEPETSVVFQIMKITDTDHHEFYLKTEILEVDR